MSSSSSGGTSPTASSPENRIAGSRQHPFKLAIVGGGPSGCSILVRAARIGMLPELCQFSSNDQSAATTLSSSSGSCPSSPSAKKPAPTSPSPTKDSSQLKSFAGVCVVDAGTMERIGGGRLQDYIINSNTWINKFATNVLDEKPDNLPPETMKGTPFDSLLNAPITKQVEDYGNKTGPLRLVGHFLRDVGQRAVAVVQAYPSSSKFYTRTKVESLHRVVEDGKFVCWRLVLVSLAAGGSSSPTNRQSAGAAGADAMERQEIYAVHVALATGGHQTMPTFANAAYRQKTVVSDVVCTMEGVDLLKMKIHRYLRTCNSHGTVPSGRVVVIGGSHSAFSAAWVCLNLVNEDLSHKLPPSGGVGAATASLAASTMSGPITLNAQNQIKFGPSGVCILHRSAIRVYYASRADADHDHYPESSIVVNRVTGNINPFGGIRGDAKELWRAIRSTKEGRVRLLQVKSIPLANGAVATGGASGGTGTGNGTTAGGAAGAGSTAAALKQSIVDKMLDEAIVIVWAAGYATNLVPLFDHNGRPIHVRVSKGQTEVDEHANLLLSEAHHGAAPLEGFQPSLTLPSYAAAAGSADFQGVPVGNLYGSGLGYGLKATLDNGEPDGASGRADGVAVYLKRGATLILASVLGNRVYGGLNIHSWEERNQLLKKQQHQQLQQQNAALALNMAQILSAGDASGAKSLPTATATPSRRASFGSPARTAATRQATPSSRAATSSVGVRTPVNASTGAGGVASHSSGAAAGSARRPASAGRVRANSINSSSAPATADAAAVGSKAAPSTKTTAVAAVTQRSGGDALDRIAQPSDCGSQNQHVEVTASLSEPSTPATALHPAKQQPPVTVKVLGSAGRAVVAAAPAGGVRAKVVTGSPVAPVHRPAPHQQLRDGIESSLAAGASSRRAAKAMPGPLALPMGAANFGLAPPAPTASPTAKHPPHSLARSLLSSSLK